MTHPFIEAKQSAWGTLEEHLGYQFKQPQLMAQAFCHSSFANENPDVGLDDNERLEFLGDAVLDLVVSEQLLAIYPEAQEGELTRVRAEVVAEPSLASMAKDLGLGESLLLGRGEQLSGGRQRPSLLADALESLFGAVFLDGGFQAADAVITPLLLPRIRYAAKHAGQDYKSRLQEHMQAARGILPDYRLVASEGPDHDRTYHVEVFLGEEMFGRGEGRTKKSAEQQAAMVALEKLGAD